MSTRRMPIRGGVCAGNSGFSHSNNPEVLLIRVSHWLWKWWRAGSRKDKSLEMAIEAMAAVKEEFRAPMRAVQAQRVDRLRRIHRLRERKPDRKSPDTQFAVR
jgi:hypothetical protein